jgi:hypothetical protein
MVQDQPGGLEGGELHEIQQKKLGRVVYIHQPYLQNNQNKKLEVEFKW